MVTTTSAPGRRQQLRAYVSFGRAALRATTAYRSALYVQIAGSLFALVALFYLWQALFAASDSLQGFTWPQMKAYLLIAFLANTLLSAWGEWRMAQRIMDGSVATDIVKPVDYQKARLSEVLGASTIELVVSSIALLVVIAAFGSIFVPGAGAAVLFAVSFVAGLVVKFGLVYATTLLCFWTTEYMGISWARMAITNLLSGGLIPLAFFPGWLRGIAMVLPFQGLVATPASIYLEQVDLLTGLGLVAIQIAWAIGLWWLARWMWTVGFRQVTIHGG